MESDEQPAETTEKTVMSPEARLATARKAFRDAEFAKIKPLLLPILEPQPQLTTRDDRNEARQLLGVGLFFEAQSAKGNLGRKELINQAKYHFLLALREDPRMVMDPLIYPASVVDLFEDVREENKEELDELIRKTEPQNGNSGEMSTVYVERQVQKNTYFLNFLPFGIGQFQNGDQIKGTLFAVTQALSLALNITSYLTIESLRSENGFYVVGADANSGDFADAQTWRNVMYGSLAAFVALYAGSVIDALLNYEDERVFIRALDEPPPELINTGDEASLQPAAPVGWSIGIRW